MFKVDSAGIRKTAELIAPERAHTHRERETSVPALLTWQPVVTLSK